MNSIRHLAALSLTLLLLAPSAGAQAPDPASGPVFGEVVDVQLVNVEAWVTDRNDRPIVGLTVDDFELFEDGEPVEISFFSEIRNNYRSALAAMDALPPPAQTEAGQTLPPDVPGHLVLYFDELHLGPASRKRLIQDVRSFISSRGFPPERVLILRQNEQLYTEAGFGSNREQLDAALERLASDSVRGLDERALAIDRMKLLWDTAKGMAGNRMSPCDWFVPRAVSEAEIYSRQARLNIVTTLQHLDAAATYLAGLEGVKTLLYMGDALETVPGRDLVSFIDGLCQRRDTDFDLLEDMAEPFGRLTRHANTNRVTIYALQAEGLRTDFALGADQSSVNFRGTSTYELSRRANARDGLAFLANETGGRAIFNKNRWDDELERISREMASYYSLAYAPPHGGDGAQHRIEVKVKGFNVRHRLRYLDKSADQVMAERLEGALYLGVMSNPLAARLGAGAIRPDDEGRFTLPLHVMVPADRVAFLPRESGDQAVLKVLVKVQSAGKKDLGHTLRTFEVPRPDMVEGLTLDLPIEIELDAGPHVVAVAVRDEATREASFVSTSFTVGDADEGADGG